MDNEKKRLHALASLKLLDTPASENFDCITRMASHFFQLPIAAISLTDSDRQWFKSKVGVDHDTIPRSKAPCAEVAVSSEFLVIEDFAFDERYGDSLLGVNGIRFYAGAPLTTKDGFCLGALCVLGTQPRKITETEISALKDLAAMVMAQVELQHAFGRIDPISGFPNRIQFKDDLADLMRRAPSQPRVAVAVDLARPNQMERLAAVLGPSACEQVTRDAACSLARFFGQDIKIYHVSSTQFVFIAPIGSEVGAYGTSLQQLLVSGLVGSEIKYAVTPVCAMATLIPQVSSATDILQALSSAILEIRAADESVGIYSRSHDVDYRRKFRLLNDFSAALNDPSQLRILLQPRVDLSTGKMVSAEALLRWTHPELGEVSPGEFIPVIENGALAWPMTKWVLAAVCSQLGEWRKRDMVVKVSVNFAASNMKQDVLEEVLTCLASYGLPRECLEIELTESSLMQNSARVLSKLDELVESGISLAIDDFGTGYSSLSYLQQLPVDVVKIDRSFIRTLGDGRREQKLVHSMIRLSHEMGYRVVAEGIEVPEAAELLRVMGCDEGQGYFFARPLEAETFEKLYAETMAAASQASAA